MKPNKRPEYRYHVFPRDWTWNESAGAWDVASHLNIAPPLPNDRSEFVYHTRIAPALKADVRACLLSFEARDEEEFRTITHREML